MNREEVLDMMKDVLKMQKGTESQVCFLAGISYAPDANLPLTKAISIADIAEGS